MNPDAANELAAFALYFLLPLLPLAASYLIARRALRAPPDEERIRFARNVAGILFLVSCLVPMALDWFGPLFGAGEAGERLGRVAFQGFRRVAGALGDGPVPFLLAVHFLPIFLAFLGTMRLDQRLARALDPAKVGRPLPAGKAAAMLGWFMLPSLLCAAAVLGAQRFLPDDAGVALRGGAGVAAVCAVILLFAALGPRSMRFFHQVSPLAEGALLSRLRALSERAGVRVRGFHVLENKEYVQANAFVTGVLPIQREVFLTPALLVDREGREEEVEAVVAHEFAHLSARHLPTYLLFSVGWIFLAFGLLSFGKIVILKTNLVPLPYIEPFMGILLMSAFLGYFFLVFRHYSRRFEAEADRIAAGLLGGSEPLARALRYIYGFNHAPRRLGRIERLFQTHDPLERRLADLESAAPPPSASKVRLPLAALVAGLALVGLDEVYVDRPERARKMARVATQMNRVEDHAWAEEEARKALALDPGCAPASHALGVSLAKRGDVPAALRWLERASNGPRALPAARTDMAALLVRTGQYEVALRALAAAPPPPRSAAARTADILFDVVLYSIKRSYIQSYSTIHYDNVKTERIYLDTALYRNNTNDILLYDVNSFNGEADGSSMRESCSRAGSRFFPLDSAADEPWRVGIPREELTALARRVFSRDATRGVFVVREGEARFVPAFVSRYASPRMVLQFGGAFPARDALSTAEIRFLHLRDGTEPAQLFDATIR